MVSHGNSDTNYSNLDSTLSPFKASQTSNAQEVIERDVVVIGSGCAGLAAAWHLNRSSIDVQLFEADTRAGGHANTVNGLRILVSKLF